MKKRILLLSDPGNPHTIKWANALSKTYHIAVCGFSENVNSEEYSKDILLYNLQISGKIKQKPDGALSKIIYLRFLKDIKKIIKSFQPDLLHSHYATSYGLLGYLTRFKPFIISVWGSDVFDFPNVNFFYKILLKFILNKANVVCATGKVLADETSRYTDKKIEIVPFGIDTNLFSYKERDFTNGYIGIIKTLAPNYGVDTLIKAFAEFKRRNPNLNYKLMIVGKGYQEAYLKNLAMELGIWDDTEFIGYVDYSQIYKYHQKINIGVFPSLKESFGVSIAELMATGGAVIASNVGGIPEIVDDSVNGFLVKPNDISKIVECLEYYVKNPNETFEISKKAREKIEKYYSIEYTTNKMINIYNKYLK